VPDRRCLAVFAHPDDIDFGAAGTIARWVDEGWDVRYTCVTSGQKGGWETAMDPEEYGALRESEQRAAAATIGVTDVTFLGWMDSEVVDSLDLRRAISREFRRHQPHRLITMLPDPLPTDMFVNHPDHRVVGQATLDVTMTGGTTASIFPDLLDEGFEPWRGLEQAWLMGPAVKPVAVDVTSTLDRKIAALRCHQSQTGDRDIESFLRGRLREAGRSFGLPYVETFRVISYRR
jgi:LmbE family N-acetylglucosaminyl deacetylase